MDSSSNDEGVVGSALEPSQLQKGEFIQLPQRQADCDAENDGTNSNKMSEIGMNIDDEEQNGQEPFLSKQVNREVPSQPQEQDSPEPPAPPPLAQPPMENVVEDCGNTADTQQSLEERVQELESKLATLSLLLHQQRAQIMKGGATSAISPALTPPDSPQDDTTRAAPALDSPAEHFTLTRQERRRQNLSFRVLYQDADFPEPHEEGFAKRNSNDDENDHAGMPLSKQEALLAIKADSLQVPDNFERATTEHSMRQRYGHNDGNAPFPLSPSPVFLRKISDSMNPIEESPILAKTSLDDISGVESNSFRTDLSAGNTPTGADTKSRAIQIVPPELPLERSSKPRGKSFDETQLDDFGRNHQSSKLAEPSSTTTISSPAPTKPSDSAMADRPSNDTVSRPRSGSTTAPPKSKSAVATENWLNYLNSFQESNHDVDKQMEEFVMVPSAVESLLSFGFWICVDSFLYSLTILPIRAIWSCLLLFRYVALRLTIYYGTNNEVPDGPYRFHRR